MTPQSRKNIRQAFLGQSAAFGTPAWHASQAAVRYVEGQTPAVDRVLSAMDLLIVAQRALLAGEDLEAVGDSGPYGTAAQRRAWAAPRLAVELPERPDPHRQCRQPHDAQGQIGQQDRRCHSVHHGRGALRCRPKQPLILRRCNRRFRGVGICMTHTP